MSNPTTLPADWAPLREAAEVVARETHDAYAAVHRGYAAWDDLPDYDAGLDGDDPDWEGARIIGNPRRIFTDAHAAMLGDLTRSASRDFWARWLAEKVGLDATNGAAVHPANGPGRFVLVCGPSALQWHIFDADGDVNRGPFHGATHVPALAGLTDVAALLRAALLAVVPHAE